MNVPSQHCICHATELQHIDCNNERRPQREYSTQRKLNCEASIDLLFYLNGHKNIGIQTRHISIFYFLDVVKRPQLQHTNGKTEHRFNSF